MNGVNEPLSTQADMKKSYLFTNGKIKNFLKKIFLPSFIYKFSSSLPSNLYIENATSKIKLLGAKIIFEQDDSVSFYLNSYKIFRNPLYGKLLISIKKSKKNEHRFSLQFVTHKRIFYIIAFSLSSLITINVLIAGEIIRIVAIPCIFFFGHIYFWSMLPSRVQKAKDFLMKLDE